MLLLFFNKRVKFIKPSIIDLSFSILDCRLLKPSDIKSIDASLLSIGFNVLQHSIAVEDTILYSLGLDKDLRYEDISMTKYLHKMLVENKLYNINLLDGYPEDDILTLPSVSVEHSISYDSPIEINSDNKYSGREYEVGIYARTKGERDNIFSCIMGLKKNEFSTVDNRVVSIDDTINGSVQPLDTKSYPVHNNYYYIFFDGLLSYGNLNNFNGLTTDYTIDFDIEICSEQNSSFSKFILYDNYSLVDTNGNPSKNGIKIYLSNNRLYFIVGINNIDFTNYINFSSLFDKRIRLSLSLIKLPSIGLNTEYTLIVYLDGNEYYRNSLITTNSMSYNLNKSLYLGASYAGDTTYDNCKFKLYGLVISNSLKTISSNLREELPYDSSIDIVYLTCNEGYGNRVYNNIVSQLVQYDYLSIYGGYNWILYFTNKSEHSICRYGLIDLKTKCIKVPKG